MLGNNAGQCLVDNEKLKEEAFYKLKNIMRYSIYWILIVRDILCLCIISFFQWRASSSQLYFSRLLDLDDKDSTRIALQDFEMLLVSVVPYKAFSKFLINEHPEMIPYL